MTVRTKLHLKASRRQQKKVGCPRVKESRQKPVFFDELSQQDLPHPGLGVVDHRAQPGGALPEEERLQAVGHLVVLLSVGLVGRLLLRGLAGFFNPRSRKKGGRKC